MRRGLLVVVVLALCVALALWLAASSERATAVVPIAERGVPVASALPLVAPEVERAPETPARAGMEMAKELAPNASAAPIAEPSSIAWTLRVLDERGAALASASVRIFGDTWTGGSTDQAGEWRGKLHA